VKLRGQTRSVSVELSVDAFQRKAAAEAVYQNDEATQRHMYRLCQVVSLRVEFEEASMRALLGVLHEAQGA